MAPTISISSIMSDSSSKAGYEKIADGDETTSENQGMKKLDIESTNSNPFLTFLFFIGTIFILAFLFVNKEISSGLLQEVGSYRPCEIFEPNRNIRVIQTSLGQPNAQWSQQPCFFIKSRRDSSTSTFKLPSARINVNFGNIFGKNRPGILGFGGAFTEAAALNFMSLSEKGRKTAMELLFGRSGLGYSLGRVHMNSCDFSIQSYSFDQHDMDLKLKHFDGKVTHDVDSGMVSMIKEANTILKNSWKMSSSHGLKMIASPWSPPYWMKIATEDDPPGAPHATGMTGSHQPNCLREGTGPTSRFAKAWALYFSKYISAYKRLGISMWGITVQNEPEFPAPWEACSYNSLNEGEFVANHLGPILNETHPEVKLFVFDHNKDHAVKWAKDLLSVSNPAAKYIDGTAIHWYAGGMDRNLDGAVGSPNMHRLSNVTEFMKVKKEHFILGTEACHCPSTGYAGGDITVSWSRAERYAHTILADLAAGSNGWIDWNLMLDSMGGPNHLGNVCDSPILAAPHRAINAEVTIPEVQDWEKVNFSSRFGSVIGNGRTKEELNSLGSPARFLDDGIVVQPMYYYMGHITRHVRPGSKPVQALVDHTKDPNSWVFRVNSTAVAGGGINNLARNGVELTVWPCEGSTRQQFRFNSKGQFQVFGHDWLGNPTTSCISNAIDESLKGMVLVDCDNGDAGAFEIVDDLFDDDGVKIVLTNGTQLLEMSCLIIKLHPNGGGAYGSSRGGAPVVTGDCVSPSAIWKFTNKNGQVSSSFLNEKGGSVCLTTGWPFLQVGAFVTPNSDESSNAMILLNEANEPANYVLRDGEKEIMSYSIPSRSIQTVLLD